MNAVVRVLLRLAEDQADPIEYLKSLMTSKWVIVSDNGGNLVNASVNGKAYSFRVPDGWDQGMILSSIETALSCAEQGVFRPSSIARGRLF